MNLTEADGVVQCARVSAIIDEQKLDSMDISPSQDGPGYNANNTDVMVTIAKSHLKRLIVEEGARIYVEGTQTELQARTCSTLVDLMQIGIFFGLHRLKMASALFLKTIMDEILICGAAHNDMVKCLEQWSKSQTVLNAVVKRVVSNL